MLIPQTAVPGTIPSLIQFTSKIAGNVLQKLPFQVYAVSTCVKNQIHWHDFTQIWYTVSGSYDHIINGVKFRCNPGSLAIIYPYTFHAVDTSQTDLENTRIISISIKNDEYTKNQIPFIPLTYSFASFDNFSLTSFINFKGREKELADDLCERVLAEFERKHAMIYSKIFSCINSLLELCALSVNNRIEQRDIHIASERAIHINNAVCYITENSMSKLPLSKVSSAAMMSERSFTDKFKTTVGQTYHNYLVSVRMAKAVDLLRFSNNSIAEISEECGFANCGHFTKVCMNIFNMTPTALRKYFRDWNLKYADYLYNSTLDVSWLFNWTDEDLAEIRRIHCGEF